MISKKPTKIAHQNIAVTYVGTGHIQKKVLQYPSQICVPGFICTAAKRQKGIKGSKLSSVVEEATVQTQALGQV